MDNTRNNIEFGGVKLAQNLKTLNLNILSLIENSLVMHHLLNDQICTMVISNHKLDDQVYGIERVVIYRQSLIWVSNCVGLGWGCALGVWGIRVLGQGLIILAQQSSTLHRLCKS